MHRIDAAICNNANSPANSMDHTWKERMQRIYSVRSASSAKKRADWPSRAPRDLSAQSARWAINSKAHYRYIYYARSRSHDCGFWAMHRWMRLGTIPVCCEGHYILLDSCTATKPQTRAMYDLIARITSSTVQRKSTISTAILTFLILEFGYDLYIDNINRLDVCFLCKRGPHRIER